MRVVIVGGGIAGLTLASALEKADIDFVLLEARARFDPQVGASIGLSAAAMRILDQLGAAQDIVKHTAPVKVSKVHRSDGKLVMPPAFTFQILKARFSYGAAFLDRQLVLRALANSIAQKDKMLLNKNVLNIEHADSGVTVNCEDGSSYHGDVVVGCDGVNSKASVRREMCRLASKEDPQLIPEAEETKMTAEFNCLFGISDPVEGLHEGEVDTTFDKGRNMLVITGKNRRVYWFYHEKLDRLYHVGAKDYPRYSKADAEDLARKNAWRHVSETVTLGDLWEKRVSYTLVPLEEALFDTWSWGRIATVGDNAHKMTPNHGQAGNNAIESAAALANQLKRVHDNGLVTPQAIKSALQKWQEKRWARITATVKEAAAVCRMQTLDSRMASFVMNYVVPNAGDSLLALVTNSLIGAEILEYLPVPNQSFEGSCPFNPNQGVGKHESVLKRAAISAPLFILSYWMVKSTTGVDIGDPMDHLLRPGQLTRADERKQWFQSLYFFIEGCATYAIWLIESNRRANVLTPAQIPTLFYFLATRFGIGVVSSCYYFLHYVFSPIEKFAAADARLTNVAYTQTILPLMLFYISLSVLLALTDLSIAVSTTLWRWILHPPLMIAIIQWILVKTGLSKVTMHEDTIANQKRDLPYIRWCVYALSAISAVTWRMSTEFSGVFPHTRFLVTFLGLNQHRTALSGLLWIGILIYDTKSAGMAKDSWVKVFAVGLVVSVIAGPTAVVALGWMWREEILASKRERHAITRDRYEGRSILDIQRGSASDGVKGKKGQL
ncbi:FAD binding domain protein [Daldinia sp. FL1419]|nr:FAD binding domain protein [Daldinia sp. FL1419]